MNQIYLQETPRQPEYHLPFCHMTDNDLRLTGLLQEVEDLLFLLNEDGSIAHCKTRNAFLLNIRSPSKPVSIQQVLPVGVRRKYNFTIEKFRQSGRFTMFESMLSLDSGKVNWYEFRLIPTLDKHLVLFIWNVNKYRDLSRTIANLPIAIEKIIEGWSRCLYLRDFETEEHTRRVTDLTLNLARRLGAPEADLVNIRRGAQAHDIGKIAIPDSILLKPDRLTKEEWDVMQQHTLCAIDMLKEIPLSESALHIPRSHHEKWDGSGYPDGLAGENIPLAARIFAFADVYDALTSNRPYRRAWAKKEALTYIREESGRRFDPALAPEFLKMLLE
ncbi:MAG: HD-GYP domain-containing protein [Chloroflexi bacterium]|nr:HD-GYP domain-containing protein [Chloroflexota bacterium]